MSEIISESGGSYYLLAKDMPPSALEVYNMAASESVVEVVYDHSGLDSAGIVTAWCEGEEIGLNFSDRAELEGMIGFYQDNQRQERAEGGE